jgi:hypothetical protein
MLNYGIDGKRKTRATKWNIKREEVTVSMPTADEEIFMSLLEDAVRNDVKLG